MKHTILYILILSVIGKIYGLRCYSCYDVIHPRFCDRIEDCNGDEICGIEKRIKLQETTFDVGCVRKSTCQTRRTSSSDSTCKTCCNSELCNAAGCGEKGQISRTGPTCFNCQGVVNMNECKHVTTCEENEVCYIDQQRLGGENYYSTGCRKKHGCHSTGGVGSIFGKRSIEHKLSSRSLTCTRCCDTKLCNEVCWNISTAQFPTTQQSITAQFTTTAISSSTKLTCVDHSSCDYLVTKFGVCSEPHGREICPSACGQCPTTSPNVCVDNSSECVYLNNTFSICSEPDSAMKSGCTKTCNYCDVCEDGTSPCMNGGKCSRTKDGYICKCSFEYGAKHCEIRKDTKGKEFHFGFLQSHGTNGFCYLYFISDFNGTCNIKITSQNINASLDISNTGVNSYRINPSIYMNQNGIQHKAVYVLCDVPVSLYGLTFTGYEVDGFLVLPSKNLGLKYIITSFTVYRSYVPETNSNFGIISTLENTNVSIKFRMKGGKVSYNNQQYTTGDVLYLTLNRHETFYISHEYDLSGTEITSSKSVAAMSGVRTCYLRNGYGNHMEEMLLPNNLLGNEFVVPTLFDSQCNFRIFGENKTFIEIFKNDSLRNANFSVQNFIEFDSYKNVGIKASKSVQVQLYCNGLHSLADAFMVTLPSIQHFKARYRFPVLNDFHYANPPQQFYLTIITPAQTENGLRLDGSQFQVEDKSSITMHHLSYSILHLNISVGFHEIFQINEIPFGLVIYGRTKYSGYGFPAGFHFR